MKKEFNSIFIVFITTLLSTIIFNNYNLIKKAETNLGLSLILFLSLILISIIVFLFCEWNFSDKNSNIPIEIEKETFKMTESEINHYKIFLIKEGYSYEEMEKEVSKFEIIKD